MRLVTDNSQDPTFAELTIGTKINEGKATVIACQKTCDRVIGDVYATWVAICVKSVDDYHPYAVWTIVARPEGWSAGNGEYAFTLREAMDYYEKRGGRELTYEERRREAMRRNAEQITGKPSNALNIVVGPGQP